MKATTTAHLVRTVIVHGLVAALVGLPLLASPRSGPTVVLAAREEAPETVASEIQPGPGAHVDGAPAGIAISRSGPLAVTHPFSMVGFELRSESVRQVRFRTADESGRWSRWHEAPVVDDEGPDTTSRESDPGSRSRFTEPVWVGENDRLEIEVLGGSTSDVRATVIDSTGASTELAGEARAEDTVRVTLAAATTAARPGVVTRAQWGADESWRHGEPGYADALKYGVVHHTAGVNDYTREDVPAILRGIYYYHTHTRGWDDIGYNFLIDRFGTIYEGRHGGIDRAVIGAHAKDFNTSAVGVAFMGTHASVQPSTAALQALSRLLAWKFDVHWVDPTVPVQKEGVPNAIVGHRDLGQTSCPGAAAYDLLSSVRAEVIAQTSFRWKDTARLTGDWDGDGDETPGWFSRGRWWLRNSHGDPVEDAVPDGPAQDGSDRPLPEDLVLDYGRAGDVPVVGDWNGDGRDTIGVVRGGDTWILRYEYLAGADIIMKYGRPGDVPVVGDWNGDGRDTIGVVRDGYRWILRYEYRSGADIVMAYGRAGDVPVTGDWSGDGVDRVGVVRDNRFILRYAYKSGHDIVLEYGRTTDTPVVGDWNGDGTDTLGIVRDFRWILRNFYEAPYQDLSYHYRPQ